MSILLNKREAADRARISERTLDRLIASDGTLPVTRIGRRVLIPEAGFAVWLSRHTDVDRRPPQATPAGPARSA